MIIHLDTSVLIDALTGPGRSKDQLTEAVVQRHFLQISTLVLFEWLRGPRTAAEIALQETLFPADGALHFDADAARAAAVIYRSLPRRRHRDVDIAIAACAIQHSAAIWTLNTEDFEDVPGLTLYRA